MRFCPRFPTVSSPQIADSSFIDEERVFAEFGFTGQNISPEPPEPLDLELRVIQRQIGNLLKYVIRFVEALRSPTKRSFRSIVPLGSSGGGPALKRVFS